MKDACIIKTVRQILPLISKESFSILDLGSGTKESNELLMNAAVEYWGVDYVNSGNTAVIEEYNQGDFPNVQADTVVCVNCLEYIKDADAFLEKMCQSGRREILLSYPAAEDGGDCSERERCGYQNHLSSDILLK